MVEEEASCVQETDRDAGPGKVYTGTACLYRAVHRGRPCSALGPGARHPCAVCGMVRWQRLAPLGHLLQFKPEDERHIIAVCRVCGRTLWRGPARDAAQKKKAARRSRSSTRNAAK